MIIVIIVIVIVVIVIVIVVIIIIIINKSAFCTSDGAVPGSLAFREARSGWEH